MTVERVETVSPDETACEPTSQCLEQGRRHLAACGGDGCVEGQACAEDSPCKQARKVAQALICAEGNIRPVVLVRSADNDYSLALTGRAGAFGIPESLYEFKPVVFGTRPIETISLSTSSTRASPLALV